MWTLSSTRSSTVPLRQRNWSPGRHVAENSEGFWSVLFLVARIKDATSRTAESAGLAEMQRKQPAPSSFLSDHRPTGRELPGPDRGRAREPTGRGPRQVSQRALRTPSSALRPLPSRAAGGTQAAAGPHLGWAGAYPRALGQGFDPLRQVPTPAPHAGHWQAAACTPVPGSQRGGRGVRPPSQGALLSSRCPPFSRFCLGLFPILGARLAILIL